MIVMDDPRWEWFRGRKILTAHLGSSILGPRGTEELLEFAARIGLKPEWIQHAGTWKEHFDLMGEKCKIPGRYGVHPDTGGFVAAFRAKLREERASNGGDHGGNGENRGGSGGVT